MVAILFLKVNNSITQNNKSNLILTGNLDISYVKIKEIICHELR